MRGTARLALALGSALLVFDAAAQSWPSNGAITVVLSNGVGSSPDIMLRLVTDRLSKALRQQVAVINRTGGNGIPAILAVTRARPDGYTLAFAGGTQLATNTVLIKDLAYDPERDLAPIAMVVDNVPMVVAANPRLAANTLPELIALAKAQPGKLSYSAAGNLPPVFGEMLNRMAGINILQVPYKDATLATTETVTGLTDVTYQSIPAVDTFYRSGKLKYLAVTSKKRFPVLPELPAVSETVPGFSMSGWFAFLGPAGLPQEIALRLNREVDVAMKEPEIVKQLYVFGFSTSGAETPQAVRAVIREEREQWMRMARDLGLKPQ